METPVKHNTGMTSVVIFCANLGHGYTGWGCVRMSKRKKDVSYGDAWASKKNREFEARQGRSVFLA